MARSSPGISCATTWSSVLWAEASSSKSTRVSTETLGTSRRPRRRPLSSFSTEVLPVITSCTLLDEDLVLGGVHLERAEGVGEAEVVDDDALGVREGVGGDDVHAPGGEGAGHVGEEVRAVGRDECDLAGSGPWRKLSWTGSSAKRWAISKCSADVSGVRVRR